MTIRKALSQKEVSVSVSHVMIALHSIIMAVALAVYPGRYTDIQEEITTLKQDIVNMYSVPKNVMSPVCLPVRDLLLLQHKCNRDKITSLWQMAFTMKSQLFLAIEESGHGAKYYAHCSKVWYLDWALGCSVEVYKCLQQWSPKADLCTYALVMCHIIGYCLRLYEYLKSGCERQTTTAVLCALEHLCQDTAITYSSRPKVRLISSPFHDSDWSWLLQERNPVVSRGKRQRTCCLRSRAHPDTEKSEVALRSEVRGWISQPCCCWHWLLITPEILYSIIITNPFFILTQSILHICKQEHTYLPSATHWTNTVL